MVEYSEKSEKGKMFIYLNINISENVDVIMMV